MRFCSKCKEWKELTEFYKNSRGGCKICIQASHRAWRLKKYPPKSKNKLPDGLRRCSKCREVKADSEFYKDVSSKTGYQHKCKTCSNIARKQRAQKYLKPKYILPDGFKKCSKCKEVKDLSYFQLLQSGKKSGQYQSTCKDCQKEYRRVNRDKIRETEKQRRNKPEVRQTIILQKREFNERIRLNPDRLAKELEYRKSYRQRSEVKQKNLEHNRKYLAKPESKIKARQTTIQWRKDNPEKANHQSNIKRIRKAQAKGSHTVEQWQELKSFFNCCPKCEKVLPLTRDHIIPLSKNGTDYIDNIQPLCRSCNSSKNDGFPIDYRPKLVRYWALDEMVKTY